MILFTKVSDPNTPSRNFIPLFILFAILMATGISFGLHALYVGHDHVFGTSREVPWGILITPYVFFACLSTGLCIVSSLGQIFRIKVFEPIVNRTVFLALIAMATGLLSIALELESPWRMGIFGLLSPNPLSNIWWKSSIYTIYLISMTFNFLFLILHRASLARVFAIVALIAVTGGNLNMNSDMALLGSRGFWAENYMPLFFLLVSTLTACCTAMVFTWLSDVIHGRKMDRGTRSAILVLGKMTLALLVGSLCFVIVKIIGGTWTQYTQNPEAMHLLVRGDFALNFWGGEVFLAVLLPLALLLINIRRQSIGLLVAGGICCLAGMAVTYYDLVIVGQLIPHFHQYNIIDLPQYYSYSPSLHEYMITMGAVFFFFTAVVFGEMAFNTVTAKEKLALSSREGAMTS
ncbi:NrfD/PsrC family molybdoenzyme membrane anchor subunit [Desulfogranum mediterraneum]|uniref:NrfD/PsrC family molybdoenzyme membrane anchor subunit n=1 Tax=Desulfogranum mediterraneum TaxID=160661 RepID=UPI0003FFE090|nr:NrfD/PsrC family molybdoenzyme membrane anchor subunit [Desulfogranum mediterraneum]